MNKLNIKKIIVGLFVVLTAISCDEDGYDDYDPGNTPTESMSGEWWIDISDEATGTLQVQHALHRTYDDNNGGLWISDRASATTFTGWYLESVVSRMYRTLPLVVLTCQILLMIQKLPLWKVRSLRTVAILQQAL